MKRNPSIKKYRISDPIRCLAVIKRACCLRMIKKKVLAHEFYVTCTSPNMAMKYMQFEVCSQSQICLCDRINGAIEMLVLVIVQ